MKKIACLLLMGLLAGCASKAIEPSYYLLRPAEGLETRTLMPSKHFALGDVAIAPYIDQPGMLMATQNGQMRPARHHMWAEPMYDGVRNFLLKEISRAKGEDIFPSKLNKTATLVEVRIDQLHGTWDGKAVLAAYWWLQRDNEVIAAYQFAETRALAADGYDAMAAAEKVLLTELAQKIADTMVPAP